MRGKNLVSGIHLTSLFLVVAMLCGCSGSDDFVSENADTKRKSGDTNEVTSDSLTIIALKYIAPSFGTADLINEHYSWYNILLSEKKQFILPHILISYLTGERYKWNNMEYIIIGEVPASYDCENVGDGRDGTEHADGGYRQINDMAPFATIKASGGSRDYVINYISTHPEKIFMLSCACDGLNGPNLDSMDGDKYNALKKLLDMENVIISVACGNTIPSANKTLNENEEAQEMGTYNSASINSKKNNKITVTGYDASTTNIFLENNDSRLPVGFGKGNIVVPFVEWYSWLSGDAMGTTSSWPTAAHSSTLGNYLSIIMHNHPSTTLEDANTIMQEKYLRAETYKYKDEDGTIKDGGTWYFFDNDKFFKAEILHEEEILQALKDASPVSAPDASSILLPTYPGLIYCAPGIYFTVDGNTYEMTESNRSWLEAAVKADSNIEWSYSLDRAHSFGVSDDDSITVQILDTKACLVPEIILNVPCSASGTSTAIKPIYAE